MDYPRKKISRQKKGDGEKIKNDNRRPQHFDFVNIADTRLLVPDDTERTPLMTKGLSSVVVVVEEEEVT